MKIRYGICSPKRAEEWGTDNVILGQCHDDDWIDFDPKNEHLYNFLLTEEEARRYIERKELEDCEVIKLELSYLE